jgi:hypothetical protein
MTDSPSAHDNSPLFQNEPEAQCLIDSTQDPVVKSLLRLVFSQFVQARLNGKFPASPFDMLYCFDVLGEAFAFKPGLDNALKGQFAQAGMTEDEWIQAYFSLS